jgi:nitroimidazol reductase NimA-like FMN-containing flavoprotein (pyridoxamine 5'-phosphate oxidase superfamily)
MGEAAQPDGGLPEGVVVLDREECEHLLTQQTVGRVAVVLAGRPMIRPVNYKFWNSSIIFQTDRGTKLSGIAASRYVEFEVDSLDELRRIAWSVIVAGTAEEVTNEGEIATFEHLGLEVWAVGHRSRWIRIRAQMIAGRRIQHYDPHRL